MPSKKTALTQLDKLVGRWQTKGTMLSGPDSGKAFSGSDIYKWLAGGGFLQHTWSVRMPDGAHRGLEIFGYDPSRKGIFAHAYDADGTFTPSAISFRGSKFVIGGALLSFRGGFSKSGDALTGIWSTTDGAVPVMELTLRRNGRKV